jgi:hypothetical protein
MDCFRPVIHWAPKRTVTVRLDVPLSCLGSHADDLMVVTDVVVRSQSSSFARRAGSGRISSASPDLITSWTLLTMAGVGSTTIRSRQATEWQYRRTRSMAAIYGGSSRVLLRPCGFGRACARRGACRDMRRWSDGVRPCRIQC